MQHECHHKNVHFYTVDDKGWSLGAAELFFFKPFSKLFRSLTYPNRHTPPLSHYSLPIKEHTKIVEGTVFELCYRRDRISPIHSASRSE